MITANRTLDANVPAKAAGRIDYMNFDSRVVSKRDIIDYIAVAYRGGKRGIFVG